MSLLKDLFTEEAAGGAAVTSAGDVAGVREPVGSKKKEKKEKKKKKTSMLRRMVGEANESTFDQADVVAKLKQAEKSNTLDQDTTAFALEDENGEIVKVWVPSEQAADFEKSLEAALSGNDNDEDEENSSVEIAEVLYDLKDKFDIVDVEWPSIPEDEEEEMGVEGGDEMAGDEMGGEGDLEGGEEDLEGEMTADETGDEMGGEEAAASALTQVIDMMKADAEARKAEAEAKAAEASAKAAEAKVKQEEEILDMEAYNKAKAEKEKEAKTLAQLAKYKHDLKSDAEADAGPEIDITQTDIDVAPEEEEVKMSLKDLADLLVKSAAAN